MEAGALAARKENASGLEEGIALFCDETRDVIKGSVFLAPDLGFVNGGKGMEQRILQAVTGWRDGGACFLPKSCGQIVNFVSAHDNYTLWDKLALSMHGEEADFFLKYEDVLAANKLAAFICFTCQGNLFLQAGEEFGRTKLGDDNSYCSSSELNTLDWGRAAEYRELTAYYRGLMRLRKNLPGLWDKSPGAAGRVGSRKIHGEGMVSFRVDNRAENRENSSPWEELLVIYNASENEWEAELPEDGQQSAPWEILADHEEADCRKRVDPAVRSIRVAARCGVLLGR